jgi:hypothetical protein
MHVCMCVRVYACMYVYVCICMYVCMCVCMYLCMYVCMGTFAVSARWGHCMCRLSVYGSYVINMFMYLCVICVSMCNKCAIVCTFSIF